MAKPAVTILPMVKRKRVDTISLNNIIEGFRCPPFQREVRTNAKLMAVVDEIRSTGVFPGILTIGVLNGQNYIVDGQHRLHARRLAERPDVLADVHYIEFDSMAEMADEYGEHDQDRHSRSVGDNGSAEDCGQGRCLTVLDGQASVG